MKKTERLDMNMLRPHYSNPKFSDGRTQTVFLADGYTLDSGRYPTVKGAEYNYSDRLRQWDWEKSQAAWDKASEQFPKRDTAEFYELYLRLYFDDPGLILVHIFSGINVGNGYDYQVYGHIPGKKADAPQT